MSAPRYLSRVQLARKASVKALAPLLLGLDRGSEDSGHRLVWSLFTDGPERKRDFLWREMDDGVFLILSERPPEDSHGLFEIDEPKLFAPEIRPGDRLGFSLRANPVVRRRSSTDRRSTRHDVVMDALRRNSHESRAEGRFAEIQEAGFAWLARQADKAGFIVRRADVRIDGYRQHRIGRRNGATPMRFSSLDFDGIMEVRDPDVLRMTIAKGFGPAKAYGCGLMLIRRA